MDQRSHELGRLVKHQSTRRGVEGNGSGNRIGQFKRSSRIDCRRLSQIDQLQRYRPRDFEDRRGSIDYPVAVEVLVENRFDRFQRRVRSGYVAQEVGCEGTVAVGSSQGGLGGGGVIRGELISARRRL